jgi:hypothetical protein
VRLSRPPPAEHRLGSTEPPPVAAVCAARPRPFRSQPLPPP